jgi:hypothetical protein
MLRLTRIALKSISATAVVVSTTTAFGQWFSPVNPCGCGVAPRRVAVARPIMQQCVQQVPVTQYQQVKQMVRRPVTEVEYVDQPVTSYRPVTETRTIDVPVTTYRDVVHYRQVAQQGGYWKTNYYNRPKQSPCAYDPRPGLLGWVNRSAYAVRASFTPRTVATRQYVQTNCTAQVPVHQRVAVQSTQKRQIQVTKYVPETTTRRVAVNKVRWVEEERVSLRPVTVMQSVPVTRTAWGWGGYGAGFGSTAISYAPAATTITLAPSASTTQTGLAPSPDPVSSARRPATSRTATRPNESGLNGDAIDDRNDINRIESDQAPLRRSAADPIDRTMGQRRSLFEPVGRSASRTPGLVRVSGWRATGGQNSEAPLLLPVQMSVAVAD